MVISRIKLTVYFSIECVFFFFGETNSCSLEDTETLSFLYYIFSKILSKNKKKKKKKNSNKKNQQQFFGPSIKQELSALKEVYKNSTCFKARC
jgi:hypothetical protein